MVLCFLFLAAFLDSGMSFLCYFGAHDIGWFSRRDARVYDAYITWSIHSENLLKSLIMTVDTFFGIRIPVKPLISRASCSIPDFIPDIVDVSTHPGQDGLQ